MDRVNSTYDFDIRDHGSCLKTSPVMTTDFSIVNIVMFCWTHMWRWVIRGVVTSSSAQGGLSYEYITLDSPSVLLIQNNKGLRNTRHMWGDNAVPFILLFLHAVWLSSWLL